MNVLPGSKVSSCDEQIKLRALLDRVSLKKKKKKKKKKKVLTANNSKGKYFMGSLISSLQTWRNERNCILSIPF